MYYICLKYKQEIEKFAVKSRIVNGNNVRYIDDWNYQSSLLNELAKLKPLRERARKLYEVIPVVYRDKNNFDISEVTAINYKNAYTELYVSMQTIVDAYEVLNTGRKPETETGFDIMLPKFKDIGEFAKCLDDLNFVITQCPYLNIKDAEIKYNSIDVGSTWITFLIGGAMTATVLTSLGKLVDAAVKIKSHVTTVKMQEELLRSMQLKNDVAEEAVKTLKQTNRLLLENTIGDLTTEIGELQDGEEKGKAQKSIEKMAYWMDKGMQIYSSIDAPKEVKDLFPEQEETFSLTDDIQKLIEMKDAAKK